eukprot:350164-Chlamydomonas_euryale.AAC.4
MSICVNCSRRRDGRLQGPASDGPTGWLTSWLQHPASAQQHAVPLRRLADALRCAAEFARRPSFMFALVPRAPTPSRCVRRAFLAAGRGVGLFHSGFPPDPTAVALTAWGLVAAERQPRDGGAGRPASGCQRTPTRRCCCYC